VKTPWGTGQLNRSPKLTEREQKAKERKGKGMKKRRTKWAAAILAVMLLVAWVPMPDVSADFVQVDMFSDPMNIKGIQGVGEEYDGYGTSHRLTNFNIMECYYTMEDEVFKKGFVLPYEYKGKKYCFMLPGGIYTQVERANELNESISIVFLMGWSDRASWLIEDAARDDGNHLYYAPKATGEAGEWLEAFFSFFCEEMSHYEWYNDVLEENAVGLHVDNFVLGNEVNMPNQWHYTGTSDPETCATKYADAFRIMYNVVRGYSPYARCCICLDHSWNNNDEGRGIAGRDFLTRFADHLDAVQPGINWCVATHLYPATLYDTDFWSSNTDLNPTSYDARIIDGRNLFYMTDYIRTTFGEQHRVMLTEQGFSDHKGRENQAAALAYSYYAAMYDPMVDCFLLHTEDDDHAAEGQSLDFRIDGTLAGEVYRKIGNGNQADQDWIASVCLPVIGVDSWSEIIPYYGQNVKPMKNGLLQAEDGNWYYYVDDQVKTDYTGLVYDGNADWWYVENGAINFNYYGLKEYGGTWWCVAGGKVNFGYTGLWGDPDLGWWYVENGAVHFGYNGLKEYGGAWWCVTGGRVDFGYTGLWEDPDLGWWYVENGSVRFGYNGLKEYGGAWWCVAESKVDFGYTGLWGDPDLGWWYVEDGTVNFGYSGLKEYNGAWWCVSGGRVDFDHTGLCCDDDGNWWYVGNGCVDFGFTGTATGPDGMEYQVVNGAVVFN